MTHRPHADSPLTAPRPGLSERLHGYHELKDFVASLQKPRAVIILVKAGAAVDDTIAGLVEHLEPGDIIIDGGNEWYENTERREKALAAKGLLYLGMGVSGGEEGARNGPAMMPGGNRAAYDRIADVVAKVAAQVPGADNGPCVTYIGPGGSGNFVKMVHNGIEYGDMQLISEAYDMLKTVGGLSNAELAAAFAEWNSGDLSSFLVEITAQILAKEDDQKPGTGAVVDKILDKTGMKGTGKWTVQQGAELAVPVPTMATALDARCLSGLKEQRVAAAAFLEAQGVPPAPQRQGLHIDKAGLVGDVRAALYASKIMSYAQGMNLIRAKSEEQGWGLDLGEMARIWQGGCIIRAAFLSDIKAAYSQNPALESLLVDPFFAAAVASRQAAWRRVVGLGVATGVALPGMSASLAYFDTYRRPRLPANLVQAQRDYFGSHTYERTDMAGWHHTLWSAGNSADSITTTSYNT